MSVQHFVKNIFSVETMFGIVIIGAAVWSAMTLDVADVAKAAFSADEKAAKVQSEVVQNQQTIQHVEGRVAKIETKIGEAKPTIVVRQVNEAPFRNDAALRERARKLRDAQREAERNR